MITAPGPGLGQQRAQDSYPGPSAMPPRQKNHDPSEEDMMAQALKWASEAEAYHGLTGNWLNLPEAIADYVLGLDRPSVDHLPMSPPIKRKAGRPRRSRR